ARPLRPAGGETIAHRSGDIRHARAAVDREDFDAGDAVLFQRPHNQLAAAAVTNEVVGQLGEDDGKLSEARFVEAKFLPERRAVAPSFADLTGVGDGDLQRIGDGEGQGVLKKRCYFHFTIVT